MDKDAFNDILYILHYQLFTPRDAERVPTLGMNCNHKILRNPTLVQSFDDIVSGVER